MNILNTFDKEMSLDEGFKLSLLSS